MTEDAARRFVIRREEAPRWEPPPSSDDLGDQPEWGYAIPWLFHVLAAPLGSHPMPAVPTAGDDRYGADVYRATGYWACLLHMMRYSLGWARPDRGLQWWFDAKKPTDDDRLALLAEVWDADGQLDWLAAWLWSGHAEFLGDEQLTALCGYEFDHTGIDADRTWIDAQTRSAEISGIANPLTGGSDPLHLSAHLGGPLEAWTYKPMIVRSRRQERRAVLLLDGMLGWYRALTTLGATLPDVDQRSWRVDVVVRPVGWLGTYRRSRITGLWFSGRHRFHLRGA